MKLQSPSRHSSRRRAFPPTGPLLCPAVCGSRSTGRESRHSDREPHFTEDASLFANHYSAITRFLIGPAAIRNARNSSAISAMCKSNRSRTACLWARFSRVLHSTDHRSRRTTRTSLIASRQLLEIHLTCSQQTRKVFLIASFSGLFGASLASRHRPITNHAPEITSHESRLTV